MSDNQIAIRAFHFRDISSNVAPITEPRIRLLVLKGGARLELTEVKPTWLDPGAEDSIQLDLTGARLPPQALEARLLDGITSVTPRLAYLGYRAWITKRYFEARQPNSYATFMEFAGRQEAALAIGLAKLGFAGNGVVGSRKAKVAAEQTTTRLEALAKLKALSIYGASFDALGLGRATDRGLPQLSEAGAKLANAVEARVSGSRYSRMIAEAPLVENVPVDALAEFAEHVGFENPDRNERAVLLDVMFGLTGPPVWLPRRDTYAMLLLVTRDEPQANESDFLRASVTPGRFPNSLSRTADGWAEYTSLDLMAFGHEHGLGSVVAELRRLDSRWKEPGQQSGGTPRTRRADEVLSVAVANPGVAALLESLRLPGLEATVTELRQHLASRCRGAQEQDGIRRWHEGWAEEDVVEALDAHAGAGAAGPLLAWCCAAERIANPARRSFERRGLWSLRSTLLPFLEEYAQVSVREAMSSALRSVVLQHLRVAWDRYADDPTINNALVATEEGHWGYVRDYIVGRMGRRLATAWGWLSQLDTLTETGLSESGASLLERALRRSGEAT